MLSWPTLYDILLLSIRILLLQGLSTIKSREVQILNKIDNFKDKYYFLSNYYECPVTYDGITYQNNEAAFQAQKCLRYEDRKQFAKLNSSEAKHLGRKISLRPDWEQIKVQEMAKIVHAKFEQNDALAKKLCDTDYAYLEEGNTWGDRVWGTVNGSGQNLLGQILMKEREKIREQLQDQNIEMEI